MGAPHVTSDGMQLLKIGERHSQRSSGCSTSEDPPPEIKKKMRVLFIAAGKTLQDGAARGKTFRVR